MASMLKLSFGQRHFDDLLAIYTTAIDKYNNLSSKSDRELELECRIGTPGQFSASRDKKAKWNFDSSTSSKLFESLKKTLDAEQKANVSSSTVYTKSDVKSVRKIVSNGTAIYQRKTSIYSTDTLFMSSPIEKGYNDGEKNIHMLRTALAEEYTNGKYEDEFESGSERGMLIRERVRFEYVFDLYKIHLTVVNGSDYSIEMEYTDKLFRSIDQEKVRALSAGDSARDKAELSRYLFKFFFGPLKELIHYTFPALNGYVYGMNELLSSYDELLEISSNYWSPKPKNIARKDVPTLLRGYSWTNKLDGVRYRLLVDRMTVPNATDRKNREAMVFLVSDNDVQFVTRTPSDGKLNNYRGTLVDLEYFKWNGAKGLHAFDCLVYKGRNVTDNPHVERIDNCKGSFIPIINDAIGVYGLTFECKKFFYTGEKNTVKDLEDVIKYMTDKYGDKIEQANDGIIATPARAHYYARDPIFKWKFPSTVSIDFLVKEIRSTESSRVFDIFVGSNNTNVEFRPYTVDGKAYRPPATLTVDDDDSYFTRIQTGQIVELMFDRVNDKFTVGRIRHDKTRPNGKKTAELTFVDMEDEFSLQLLVDLLAKAAQAKFGKTVTPVAPCLKDYRKFNNNVKRAIILSQARNARVLDLGAGKGGDLDKYKRANISKLWAVEPNISYIKDPNGLTDRLNSAYKSMRGIVTVINAGAQDYTVIKNAMMKQSETGGGSSIASVVSSFFSMSFFFQNSRTLDDVIKTVSENLEVGGKFVGTMMDGDRTFQLLNSDNGKVVASDDCWTMNRYYDPNSEIGIGLEIGINLSTTATVLGEQKEWISPFGVLVDRLKRVNIELVGSEFFDDPAAPTYRDFANLSPSDQLLASLYRSFVFQKVKTPEKIRFEEGEKILSSMRKKNSLPSLAVNTIESGNYISPTIYPEILYRTGAIGDGSCFFHSFLYLLMTEKYEAASNSKRKSMVKKVRESMSRKFSPEMMRVLANGELELSLGFTEKLSNATVAKLTKAPWKLDEEKINTIMNLVARKDGINVQIETFISSFERLGVSSNTLKQLVTAARGEILSEYVRKLASCSSWTEHDTLEYIMRATKHNIFVIEDSTREPVQITNCNLYDPENPSVVILNLQGLTGKSAPHFEPLYDVLEDSNGDQYWTTLFPFNHPLIKSLYSKLCTI